MADDLAFHEVYHHFSDVRGVVCDALDVLGNIGDAHGAGDGLGVLEHEEEQLIEYLVVQIVHEVIVLAHAEGEVRVPGHEGVEAVFEHALGGIGHARDVDIGLERRLVVQLNGALADVHGQVPHALQVGDDLDGRGDEPEIAARRLPEGEHADAVVLDLHIEGVDRAIAVDDGDRQGVVALHQGLDGFPDGVFHQASHLEHAFFKGLDVLLFLLGHEKLLLGMGQSAWSMELNPLLSALCSLRIYPNLPVI